MMKDVKKNFNGFVRKINEASDISEKIKPILDAMYTGISSDYRLKEGLINNEKEELEEVILSFSRLKDMKAMIE